MSDALGTSPLVQAIGVTLVEFLWHGTLIALMAAAALRALRASDPAARYLVGVLTLAAMTFVAIVTAVITYRSLTTIDVTATTSAVTIAPRAAAHGLPASTLATALTRAQWMPAIVAVWGVGVTLCSAHLGASWLMIGFVRRGAVRLGHRSQRHLAHLAKHLGIHRTVRIAESVDVLVPTVMGWIRPLIVVPVSTLAGLSPRELDAILIHELAHVRRQDYLVNIGQTTIETLLFYHPAVWWVSRRIREERELCCDDLVVAISGDRLTYARALAELEAHRLQSPALAVAANGGKLMNRITRLLRLDPREPSTTSTGGVLALIVSLPFLLLGQTATATHAPAPPSNLEQPAFGGRSTTAFSQAASSRAMGSPSADPVAIQRRYAALVGRFEAVTSGRTASAAQSATPSAAPTPAPQGGADPGADRRRQGIEQDAAQTISVLHQLIEGGKTAEAQKLLDQLAAYISLLSQPAARPAPRTPTAPPTATEREAANYAQGLAASSTAPDAQGVPTGPVRIGGSVAAPTKIRDVPAIYPEEAKAARVQGIVIIEAVIDQGGNVTETRVLRGDPMLKDAAVQAVSQWKFTPTTLSGQPVSVLMTVTVNFTLQ